MVTVYVENDEVIKRKKIDYWLDSNLTARNDTIIEEQGELGTRLSQPYFTMKEIYS